MATRLLFALSHESKRSTPKRTIDAIMASTSTNSKRRRPQRNDFPTTNNSRQSGAQARPPRQQGEPKPRPTHFLALPIGHHADLRSAISALTSSWLAHEPPIDGLDPSIVVHPRRLHLTLGVMVLDTPSGDHDHSHDLAGATALLASLAPRIRAVLAHNPLRVPLSRLAVMQPDPTRAHVLYIEPDLRSPDGRRLRAVCGACVAPSALHTSNADRIFRSRSWRV
jgi:activating signal cointegrator complex subunit 1